MINTVDRNKAAHLYMVSIIIIGWGLVFFSFINFAPTSFSISQLLFLIVLLFICEYFPIPVPKGHSVLTFPILYIIYVLFNIEITVVVYACIVLVVNALHKRPFRSILFNPAQLVLSFFTGHLLVHMTMEKVTNYVVSPLWIEIFTLFLFITCFYLINNILVDVVLLIRPERYSLSLWLQKGQAEFISYVISFIYGTLSHILGSQNRGEIDTIALFFFFSPIVALSLLSSIIARLNNEKNRLKALFQFSSELNKAIPVKEWKSLITKMLQRVIYYDECVLLWKNEWDQWELIINDGNIGTEELKNVEVIKQLEEIKSLTIYDKKHEKKGPLHPFLRNRMSSVMYVPLIIDGETVGCLIVTKPRTKSFLEEDIRSIVTIGNQLAIFLKTKMLSSEKERRMLLEERNRIAHDIHDGIAQTLAGAVMKLDTSIKKVVEQPNEAKRLIIDSNEKLRLSLKEVRDSIYALRPYPTERLGLHQAIKKKVEEILLEPSNNIKIKFSVRGQETKLSPMVEKVMFSVFQECIQNCLKHSQATNIHILVSYRADHILLKISDNGVGFSLYHAMISAMNEPHYGILQMNENAEKIGATLQIDSRSGEGAEVTLTVPKIGYEGDEYVDQSDVS
ncbi:GAF domain-containing sensor histidine kinase [Sutcliffiella cohnii]